jgi:hypothetical protein
MGNYDGKRAFWAPGSKLENNKTDIKEIWFENFD